MNKLRLMERDIDHENEIRLECVQRSIENRMARDKLKIHKKIDRLNNMGRTAEFHLQQRQVKNSNKQLNSTRLYAFVCFTITIPTKCKRAKLKLLGVISFHSQAAA